MKYRKKPVVIDAVQYLPNDHNTRVIPQWLFDAYSEGTIVVDEDGMTLIKTLEGNMLVSDGDYIIKGVQGELYPCKPAIFEATYEKVA